MRILLTFIGGSGHFLPLVPVARAAQVAGHTVTFGCGPSMAATVRAAGFTVRMLGSGPAFIPQRKPLRPLDPGREDREFRDRFARQAAQKRAPLTLDLCHAWRPDILVCDETDFGSMVAAERLSIPYAIVLVMAAGSFVRPEIVGAALGELRALHGLSPDPTLEMLRRFLVLAPFPPGFRDPAFPLPDTAFSYRPGPLTAGDSSPPPWATVIPGAPVVYFTLGTIFNLESSDLFDRVLAGLRTMTINVIVTVGRYIDPAEFIPQPAHIYLEQYIPQQEILPHCDLLISHGGSGSVAGALACGVPQVLIPLGADQPLNAARCRELGTGLVLDPVSATPQDIRQAVSAVLADPGCQQAAGRMQKEIAALPGVAQTVPLLEHAATSKEPVFSHPH